MTYGEFDDDEVMYLKCSYCSRLFPAHEVRTYYAFDHFMMDGTKYATAHTYCSDPCGQKHEPGSVSA